MVDTADRIRALEYQLRNRQVQGYPIKYNIYYDEFPQMNKNHYLHRELYKLEGRTPLAMKHTQPPVELGLDFRYYAVLFAMPISSGSPAETAGPDTAGPSNMLSQLEERLEAQRERQRQNHQDNRQQEPRYMQTRYIRQPYTRGTSVSANRPNALTLIGASAPNLNPSQRGNSGWTAPTSPTVSPSRQYAEIALVDEVIQLPQIIHDDAIVAAPLEPGIVADTGSNEDQPMLQQLVPYYEFNMEEEPNSPYRCCNLQ